MVRDLRIAHVADTHLGYRSNTLPGRDEDFTKSWLAACRAIVDSAPDLILHAGDVFHHPHPSWGAVFGFLEGAQILREAKIPIFLISGNHDTSRINLKYTIFSVLQEAIPHITVCHEPEPTVHCIPELDVEIVLLCHRALVNKNLEENLKTAISSLTPSKRHILVSHGSVGDLDQSKELGSVVVPDFVFEHPWSYVALGHLHMAQPFGRNGWYSGSTERCGWSDYPANPAWTATVLSADGTIQHRQHSVPHLHHFQLPALNCSGLTDQDIVEDILTSLMQYVRFEHKLVVRILLKGIPTMRQRVLQSVSQRRVKETYPNVIFQVVVEGSNTIDHLPRMSSRTEQILTIEDSFRTYVGDLDHRSEVFREDFLTKGLEVLSKARSSMADADTGDERSVPLG